MTRIRVALGLAVLVGCMAFAASPAAAAVNYVLGSTFNGKEAGNETPEHGLELTSAVAVYQATGTVYTTNWFYKVVDLFDQNGVYLKKQITGESIVPENSFQRYAPGQIGIDNSGGAYDGFVYLLGDFYDNLPIVYVFDDAGNYRSRLTGSTTVGGTLQFSSAGGVAVDSTGSVYIAETGATPPRVLKYTPTGSSLTDADLVAEITGPGVVNPTSLAIDAADNLYVTNPGNNFAKFDSAGDFKGPVGATPANGGTAASVAINKLTGEQFFNYGNEIVVTDPADAVLGRFYPDHGIGAIAIGESTRRLYVLHGDEVDIFEGADVPLARTDDATDVYRPGATLHGLVNTDGEGDATCEFEYGTDTSYGQTAPCTPAGPYTDTADHPVSAAVSGLATETTYHFRIAAKNANGTKVGEDRTFLIPAVPGLATTAASDLQAQSAVLHGSFDPGGEDTHYVFEWGADTGYGNTAPAAPGTLVPGSASGVQPAATPIAGLEAAHSYHYRIVATNQYGTSYGQDVEFSTPPLAPEVLAQSVTQVHPDSATLHAHIEPGGGVTEYHFEYGLADCSANPCAVFPVPDALLLDKFDDENVSQFLGGLQPGTTYHFRVIAKNASGTATGNDRTFHTFSVTDVIDDPCPNAHARQQTSAALLLDCRAYELVSAADTGGYNVEADLVPGQRPFGGYPEAGAPARALYAVHDGGIPGTGNPTNHGPDPYLATRGERGWSTRYVGVPANLAVATGPFGSPLLEASADLTTFAFGGAEICDPCFADGSTNVPLRLPDGGLVKGMAGSHYAGPAEAGGVVRRRLSADGSHFVFGSTAQFEPDGNSNGDLSIYDRNLETGVTQVVSKLPNGTTMTGPGVAELDISADGTRIVVATRVSTDAAGNAHWHPYLHVGGSPNTIDLAPGVSSGVLYGGMAGDGSAFFFTTSDPLAGDIDTSADLYRADVTGTSATLTRISTGSGGVGNSDACDPAANSANADWNSVDAASDCSVAAIAGGGGIGRGSGAVYFLSPELLDGPSHGIVDAPNLYLARPGQAPRYVTTLESGLNGTLAPPRHTLQREQGIVSNPTALAVDAGNGDLYVADAATSTLQRYDSAGNSKPFSSSQAQVTGNRLTGSPRGPFGFNLSPYNKVQVAIDSSGGPTDGYIYLTDSNTPGGGAVIDVFDATGAYRGELPEIGFFGGDCGVAVGPAGEVYVSGFGQLRKYTPVDGDPANNVEAGTASPFGVCQVAVDSTGAVYGRYFFEEKVERFAPSSFGGALEATPVLSSGAAGIAVDPATDDLYVNRGGNFLQFDPSGKAVGESSAPGVGGSAGIAIDTDGEVYVANPPAASVAVFGPTEPGFNPAADSPVVTHAVNDAETHRYADFQVTPSGDHAAFPSTLALTGYDTAAHTEVYRFAAGSGAIDCTSCAPTGVQASGDASLAPNGLSLSEDGRVFFNSTDELVPRDLNRKKDAYEWSDGTIELISTGTSGNDSSLLGISADGTDAYFFTRERLVDEDQNGSLVRIYDARAEGGFATLPPQVPCQASDECHGASSESAPPPPIGTFRGTLGNATPKAPCKKGQVRKGGKCRKKPGNQKKSQKHRGKKHKQGRNGKGGRNDG